MQFSSFHQLASWRRAVSFMNPTTTPASPATPASPPGIRLTPRKPKRRRTRADLIARVVRASKFGG